MKEEMNSFLDTIVNYAVVIRADLKSINELKQVLAQNPCINVVYQKYSFNKLIIREIGETDDKAE
jgi:hypothetical protein